jgi:hypothetical protein
MNMYIDEAGNFHPPPLGKRQHKYSLVLSLVIPTESEAELFYAFLRLRDTWPCHAIEIKGSKLSESQTAQVMKLLASHSVIAEYYAIDMALHQSSVIEDFKMRHAAAVTANLTDMHSPAIVQWVREQANIIREMSNQLFVQAFVTMTLIVEMLDKAVNYFAQRQPKELGTVSWTIDQKDKHHTQMEQLWTSMILPYGESYYARKPFAVVEGFDYSHFEKYLIRESTADDRWKHHLDWMRRTFHPSDAHLHEDLDSIDMKRILTEQQTFCRLKK